ncbi:hypothetical protein [Ponticaulis sp.]|uniref:hypothetical protein n=1 Tax=Ponticaulis sp. TaxID=2020902 RepID=UPI000B6B5B0F|nr:hypothetical protein [Ponticaulis sp.]MAJ07883.1 hypothetical protein [Ponticaulis sp.]RPG18197.1 MAG: hypothetical protein CBC85_002910 [Hyphomonadaceae bacterium TMED125]HBJ91252.1 hypothetical protein [Hyphomonadaceae bacterium]|tara:strand:+ start:6700 stop:7590 length:891 start_codon:yes stop_codon:yes gene_type:complete
MKYALPVSILVHVAIGASGLFVWSTAPREGVETFVEVPLDIVNIAEETNIREVRRPEPETQPEPEAEEDLIEEEGEDEVDELPSPSNDIGEIADEQEPEDIPPPPEEQPPEEDIPPPPPEEVEEEEDQPEPPVTRPPPQESGDPFADLLDGIEEDLPDESDGRDDRRNRNPTVTPLEDQDQPDQRGAGAQTGNTATVEDVVRTHIVQQGCWRSTSDLPDWQSLDVTVSFRLDADGNIIRTPRVIDSARPVNSDRFIRAAADRAIRAVRNCEPFPLPPDQYDLWRNEDINILFNEQF